MKFKPMGIINKGINGPFKGKTGSVIGSSWKKISYIKGLPKKKNVKRTPSPEQTLQQRRFKLLNDFLHPISTLLKIGFSSFLSKSTSVSAAFSYNYEQAFLETDDRLSLDYKALQLSRGSLCMAGAERAWIENGGMVISWNPKTYGMGGEMDDTAHVLVYHAGENVFLSDDRPARRQDGATFVDVSEWPLDETFHVWLFFADQQQKRVSQTVYIPVSYTAS